MPLSDEQAQGVYGLTAAQIQAEAQALYERIVARIRKGQDPRSATDAELASFSGAYLEIMANALGQIMETSIGVKEMKSYPIGPVSLSDALYRQAKQISAEVRRIVKDHAQFEHDARQLAKQLFDGYGHRDPADEPLQPKVKLPKYIQNAAAMESEIDALLAKMQASTLKTAPLRAAYMQALDAILNKVDDSVIRNTLRTAIQERYRYFANRIAQTELHRAQTDQIAKNLMGFEQLDVVQIVLSHSHPKTDICDRYAGQDAYGLGPGLYPKAKAPKPPYHPHCLPGDSLITSCGRISAVSKRWYEGDIVVITMASGEQLTATPNHPVLTPSGWCPIGSLKKGFQVVSSDATERPEFGDNDYCSVPASISEIAEAFFCSSKVLSREVPTSAPHFHGDGMNGQVAIIGANSELWDRVDASTDECIMDDSLMFANDAELLLGDGISDTRREFCSRSPDGRMRSAGSFQSFVGTEASEINRLLLAGSPESNAVCLEDSIDRQPRYSERLGDGISTKTSKVLFDNRELNPIGSSGSVIPRLAASIVDTEFFESAPDSFGINANLAGDILKIPPGSIQFQDVVNVDRYFWCGHVYNLETDNGYYTCNGIVIHNCRCLIRPRLDLSAEGAEFNPNAASDYLKSLDESTAAQVAGSKASRDAILDGADADELYNAGRPDEYKVRGLGDVVDQPPG